jgi:hypothetical protein
MSGGENPDQHPILTPSEFVQIVSGTASDEVRQKFLAAVDDPTSELHEVLLGLEEWSRRLPGPAQRGDKLQRVQQQKFSFRLGLVQEFIDRKQVDKAITPEEAEQISSAGGIAGSFAATTPRQAMSAIVRMTRVLDELHPELHEELAREISRQEASHQR